MKSPWAKKKPATYWKDFNLFREDTGELVAWVEFKPHYSSVCLWAFFRRGSDGRFYCPDTRFETKEQVMAFAERNFA